ncbi:MAG TPA: hypothetical protein VN938_09150 [Xanthobacteraceae bacterium]|jgi:hypothetical protein|nr:hypothetical protein [Xanthobacteraceae bacterium]
MTDYHPLIARAVEGLQKSTGEARRALYERARTALVTQLRSVDPPLSETEITKERLALEDAIRKVEGETARKARTELRETRVAAAPPRRSESAAPRPAPAPAAAATKTEAQRRAYLPPSARERLLSARAASLTRDGIKGFRDAVGGDGELDSEQDTRDSYGAAAASARIADPPNAPARRNYAQRFENLNSTEHLEQLDGRESGFEFEDDPAAAQSARYLPTPTFEHEAEQARPPRSYRGLAKLIVALVIFAGVAGLVTWQWSNLAGVYHRATQIGTKPPTQTTTAPPAAEPKFAGRVPQEGATQAPAAGAAPSAQPPPAVAQRVVLYEEDPNDPSGKRYAGSAIWRTETVSPGSGLAPELAVRADIEIPERRMTVTWSLRRNTDQALPASHTIEVMFNLPADFAGGGIANVPGILMKQSEQARGTPLAGLAVKVTNGFFLIGLSAVEADMQRNVQLLKDRPWFDIPIVYTNGGRAILAMEKGPPGDRAFAEAFATWEKK